MNRNENNKTNLKITKWVAAGKEGREEEEEKGKDEEDKKGTEEDKKNEEVEWEGQKEWGRWKETLPEKEEKTKYKRMKKRKNGKLERGEESELEKHEWIWWRRQGRSWAPPGGHEAEWQLNQHTEILLISQ